ncbi:M15 family metallopeptidase [Paenibacillus harenae]|uniref:M15 family metallopeptidase n=1 Tax=Paenibacillus harenae TaxID=306543 RepID=UPI00278F1456|nr:M15 family metallopeptidase [Paenibacillus harenae]MDQ0061906.1 D-alanyl-D-alanine carboxypeptidase [Paenibacillus harenae]
MKKRRRIWFILILCLLFTIGYSFVKTGTLETIWGNIFNGGGQAEAGAGTGIITGAAPDAGPDDAVDQNGDSAILPTETPDDSGADTSGEEPPVKTQDEIAVVAEPDSITALVNPVNKLPEDYNPTDLVYPDVRFVFDEKIEKRMMRQEAASALEKMFAAADADGLPLAGVSAYRSHQTQTSLFDRYVKKDGLEKAKTYSAVPGTSEHETGLAIDVTASDGSCAVEDCFGDMPESAWLDEHAAEYGFIVRYPEGKDAITTYQYEPWHLRYVGKELAQELAQSGDTLEEYYGVIPVSK